MSSRFFVRALCAFWAIALLVTACGSDTSTTETSTGSDSAMDDEMADSDHGDDHGDDEHGSDEHGSDEVAMSDDGHEHSHGEGISADDFALTPAITVEAFEDPLGGWNINAVPINHTIAPMSASTDHVAGEGHMHLFVDDVRIGRIYSEWVHVADLAPGDHEIRVELSANNHSQLTLDGEPIDQTVSVTQGEAAAGHAHGAGAEPHIVSGDGLVPGVSIQVFEDPKSGWNINTVPSEFELAPWNASTDFVEGEGHMHLYIDGRKITRLYGEWYHLGDLTDGDHEIRVELSGNDHQPLSFEGQIIEAVTTITQVDGIVAAADATADADQTINIMVMDGQITGDSGRQVVNSGDTIAIIVSGDVSDDVHVHGYDLFEQVGPSTDAVFVFEADIPGIFEVELEGSGELLTELQVS